MGNEAATSGKARILAQGSRSLSRTSPHLIDESDNQLPNQTEYSIRLTERRWKICLGQAQLR